MASPLYPPSKEGRMDRDQILSPRVIEDMIAQGQTIVIFDGMVLRLDSWLEKHPGGRLAILHMVGKDATDEIMAYHRAPTLISMKAFRIGRKPMGPWINMTPPIRGGVYRSHAASSPERPDSIQPQPCSDATSTCTGYRTQGVKADDPHRLSAPQCSQRRSHSPPGPGPVQTSTSSPPSPSLSPYTDKPDGELDAPFSGADRQEHTPPSLPDHGYDKEAGSFRGPVSMAPTEYTDWAVEQGIEKGLEEYPSLDLATQQDIVRKYRVMHQRIIDEGLYQCRFQEYGKELARYLSFFALFLITLHYGYYTISAVFLGIFWHQIMFSAHDAGHRAITQNFVIDTLIGVFIADFCCGLSIGWWKSSHNVHHLITNHPEHDPDIQNVPLFATCPSFFRSIVSSYYDGFTFVWDGAANFMVRYQKYTYYPVMAIARFNLYLLSWMHVLSTKSSSLGNSKAWWIRPAEIISMASYWFLFGYCLVWCSIPTWTSRVIFVVVSHVVLMPLHVQINLSHWGMSTADLGEAESFPQRQMRTTMDVDCPAWLDWFHGGLQFQAVHHLFPRLPRHNLRKVQQMIREFSSDTKIPYSIMGFVDGNRKVLGRLGEVSEQVKILIRCQNYMAEAGEMGFL